MMRVEAGLANDARDEFRESRDEGGIVVSERGVSIFNGGLETSRSDAVLVARGTGSVPVGSDHALMPHFLRGGNSSINFENVRHSRVRSESLGTIFCHGLFSAASSWHPAITGLVSP